MYPHRLRHQATALLKGMSGKELEKISGFLNEGKPEDTLNDLFWSLLNSKEFIFNH